MTYDIATLMAHLDASPTARHVVARATSLLNEKGFIHVDMHDTPTAGALRRGYVTSGGTLVAWTDLDVDALRGLRIVGAHTDSPGLTIKPGRSAQQHGFGLLNVEVYGGPLLNSWLDRDVALAGSVLDVEGRIHLFATNRAVARISQLAIHLDREVNDKGLVLDRQTQLRPTGTTNQSGDICDLLAAESGIARKKIAAWDCRLVDVQHAAVIGDDASMLVSGRLDNQLSCWAALHALLGSSGPNVIALFDHEEIGSQSATGAESAFLPHVLERMLSAAGLARDDYVRTLLSSHAVSSDNAHAVHPNYPERHDLDNAPLFNRGIAVKWNSNQRYATTIDALDPVLRAARSIDQELQHFSSKHTMPCGSTIGPITASVLGVPTVDVGIPQLSMHSSREVCGVDDAVRLERLLAAYFARA
ncbi:MAG: M18 family aminopeptidase [Actinomycetota bacterium]